MRSVLPRPLTQELFAAFGDVVSARAFGGQSANLDTATRFDRCAKLESTRAAATANLAVFRSRPVALPFEVRMLEQHPCSTQTFLPLICQRFLICVAPTLPGGQPDENGIAAFVAGPGQGISYDVGVWHHPIIALDELAEFAMLAWEDGTAADCVEQPLAMPVRIIEVEA